MGSNQQTKYRYQINIITGAGSALGYADAEDVTLPTRSYATISQFHNKTNGQIKIQGRAEYSDCAFKMALENRDDGLKSDAAIALGVLQNLASQRLDTCDIAITMFDETESISYILEMTDCLVREVKLDDITRKSDDDVMMVSVSVSPTRVKKIRGPQMP